MEPIRFFEAVEYLEPHCPNCEHKLEYGVTTAYDDRAKAHKCLSCGTVLK